MAILCSVVLVVAPMLSAMAAGACRSSAVVSCGHACCRPGHMMACCATSAPKPSAPIPANNTRSVTQNDFSLLALALLTSLAPVATAQPHISQILPPLIVADAPLHERLCVRLI